jgi:hypothetical protein
MNILKGKAICYQPISNIQVVCQDELDLNCFAYIFKDGNKDFSHVFCVLTAVGYLLCGGQFSLFLDDCQGDYHDTWRGL